MKGKMIHEKAIRLLEGGVVEVDGYSVRAIKAPIYYYTCEVCDMDCLCHKGTEMALVCNECDSIGNWGYYLKLINRK